MGALAFVADDASDDCCEKKAQNNPESFAEVRQAGGEFFDKEVHSLVLKKHIRGNPGKRQVGEKEVPFEERFRGIDAIRDNGASIRHVEFFPGGSERAHE